MNEGSPINSMRGGTTIYTRAALLLDLGPSGSRPRRSGPLGLHVAKHHPRRLLLHRSDPTGDQLLALALASRSWCGSVGQSRARVHGENDVNICAEFSLDFRNGLCR